MSLTIHNKVVLVDEGEFNPDSDLTTLRLSPHFMPKVFNKDWALSEPGIEALYDKLIKGKKTSLNSDAVRHGIKREDDSIALINEKLGTSYVKNDKRFDNGTFNGEPDVLAEELEGVCIVDVKTVWPNPEKENPVETFDKMTEAKAYTSHIAQLISYHCLLETQMCVGKLAPYIKVIYTDLLNRRIKVYKLRITPNDKSMFQSQVKRLYKILLTKFNYEKANTLS